MIFNRRGAKAQSFGSKEVERRGVVYGQPRKKTNKYFPSFLI